MMRFSLVLALALMAPATWAQSFDDLATHLGTSLNLQGTQQSLSAFAITVVTNETHALVAINATKSMSEIGWCAVGFGTQMSNSDMVIVWPNSDSSWTMSHRTAGGHQMPQDRGAAGSDLIPIPDLTTNSSSSPFATFAFMRPLSFSTSYSTTSGSKELSRASGQQFIYAYSDRNPGSSSQTATITQHNQDAFGAFTMDLSKAVSSTAGVQIASPAESSPPWTRRDSIIVLHALCGCLAWLIFAPAAVLIGRLGRDVQGWFRMHQLIQSILTLVLSIVAVALGAVAVNEAGSNGEVDAHRAIGFVILALLLVQVFLGFIIHRLLNPNRTKRPIRNVVHIVLGVTLSCLGYIQVFKGFGEYERETPGYVIALAAISLIGFCLLYLFSCLRLVQKRHERGFSWRMAAFGLGRSSPIALSEKHALDPFAQPPPPRSPRLADKAPFERAQSTESHSSFHPISDHYAQGPAAKWEKFNDSESELPWQPNAESRVSKAHYGAFGQFVAS